MNDPLVSIIIPVYNAGNYLAETIISALDQTWPNKEIIVIDNGSTDNSVEIARAFGNKIKLYHENKKGASAARNKGLTKAKGDYIQFLDADDLLKNDKIELQLNAIKNMPGVVAYGPYADFFDSDNLDHLHIDHYIHTDYLSGKELLYDLYGGNDKTKAGGMLPQHSWLTPRSIINTAGTWNIALTVDDDGEFFCRVALHSNGAKYLPGAICYYRRHRHNNNLSAQNSYQSWQSAFNAVKLKQQHLGDEKKINALLANQAMHLLLNIYPLHGAFCNQINQFINKMGGTTWKPYQQGPHKIARLLFGWKIVRLLSYYKNNF